MFRLMAITAVVLVVGFLWWAIVQLTKKDENQNNNP